MVPAQPQAQMNDRPVLGSDKIDRNVRIWDSDPLVED
jgi:hypothetical protein